MVPQGASRLEECRVAGYPAVRLVLRREAPCEPNVRPANFPECKRGLKGDGTKRGQIYFYP